MQTFNSLYWVSDGGRGEPKQVGRVTPCAPLCATISRRARSDAPYPPSLRHYNSLSFSLASHQAQVKALKRLLRVSDLVNRNAALDEQPHDLICADTLVQGDELAVALVGYEFTVAKFPNCCGKIANLEPDPSIASFCGGQGTFEHH